MSSNPTALKVQTPNQSRSRSEKFRSGFRRVTRKSDAVPTRFILSAADNQAVNWTIGSKPNVNLPAKNFGARKQVRKKIT